MTNPKISIIIPVKLNGDISSVMESIKNVDYPKKHLEVIVAEGNWPSSQRNKAINKAGGKIIFFLDNDSRIQPWSLNLLEKKFSDPQLAVLGGPSLTSPKDTNYFSKLIGYILETYFGALRMRWRYSSDVYRQNATEYELIGANLAIRKNIFSIIPGFDESLYANEETDLLRRISDMGYKMKYNKKFFIYRSHRKNPAKLIKQFFKYGEGRMMQIEKKAKFEDLVFGVPVIFVIYLFSLLFIHQTWYFLPLLIYFLLGFASSLKVMLKYKKIDVFFVIPFIFPFIHISYAFGLIKEIYARYLDRTKKTKIIKKGIKIRKITF